MFSADEVIVSKRMSYSVDCDTQFSICMVFSIKPQLSP
jgi:hypothetical protein